MKEYYDWRNHIENAIGCYITSLCNDEYTKENMIQCCIDLCGYIDDRTMKLIGGDNDEH